LATKFTKELSKSRFNEQSEKDEKKPKNSNQMMELDKLDMKNEQVLSLLKGISLSYVRIKNLVEKRFEGVKPSKDPKNKKNNGYGNSDFLDHYREDRNLSDFMNFFETFQKMKISSLLLNPDQKTFSPLTDNIQKEANLLPISVQKYHWINKNFQETHKGKLTCMAKSQNLVLLGSDFGEVIEYTLKTKNKRVFKIGGVVLSIDINPSQKIWAAGSSNSHIFIKKVDKWAKKTDFDF